MRSFFVLILLSGILLSCSPEYWPGITKEDHVQNISIPADEGEEWHHARIFQTKQDILKYAKKLGVDLDLERIPIIVRVSNEMNSGLNGTCNYDVDGTPRFIEIYTDVFKYEQRAQANFLASPLFVVLLHEIGHCYYFRGHENGIIEEPGIEIRMNGHFFTKVAPSVMVLAPSYYFPRSMIPYYVAEILGLQRANNFKELRKFVRFQLYSYF